MFQLSRKQSVVITVGVLGLFFISTLTLVSHSRSVPEDDTEASSSSSVSNEPLDNAEFVLDNFQRKEMQGEKLVWEVNARRGHYAPGGGRTTLEDAVLWVYGKTGGRTRIQAKQAILFLNGDDLVKAEMSGGVTILKDDQVLLETERANYDKPKDLMTSDDKVHMVDEKSDVTGIGMETHVAEKDVKILKDVRTQIRAKVKPTEKPK